MEKRTLGKTGLQVTVLGYGAMAVRRDISDDDADRVLNAVLDAGINFIDTAPDYGRSEDHIGRAISHRRDEYYLATKCGCNVGPDGSQLGDETHIWTRVQFMKNIENSLALLKTDHVDIWQPHNPSTEQFDEGELLEAMQDAKRQGKVRHIGISSTLPDIKTYIDRGVLETYQIPYSVLGRNEENSITAAAKSGAGTIIRGGVAKGVPDGPLGESQRWAAWERAGLDDLRGDDESRSAFVLRFTIAHPHLHTTIVGTRNIEHLAENLKAVEAGPLPEGVCAELKRRMDGVGFTAQVL